MYYRALSFPVVQMLFFRKHAMCTTQRFPWLWLHDILRYVIHRRVLLSMVHMQDLHPSVYVIHSADSFSMATKCIPACIHSGILCSMVHMDHFQAGRHVATELFCSLWSKCCKLRFVSWSPLFAFYDTKSGRQKSVFAHRGLKTASRIQQDLGMRSELYPRRLKNASRIQIAI